MSHDMVFWLALAGLVATCTAAIGAHALAGFSRHELEEICRRRSSPERLGQILRRYERAGLAAETLQVVATVVVVGAGAFWVWLQSQTDAHTGWMSVGLSLAGGALVLLAAEIWIPRAVARLWAEPILYYTWPVWYSVDVLLRPLTLGATFVDTVFHRLVGRQHETADEDSIEEEIRTVVTEGHREGLLEEEARDMIEGIIELGDVDVSGIMIPRTDMVTIPADMPWGEMLAFVTAASHTRIPVHGKNRDDIVGVLYAKDLLPHLVRSREEPQPAWTTILRRAHFVPETKPVDVLLQEFQQTRNHMAIVLDEYGGVSGLVTLEDVLEEIVGEIVDEYDRELEQDIARINDATAEALGRAHVDEINEALALELPEDADYDTIGGFVFSALGHVPAVGETVEWKNVRITVLEATPRRVERVRIEVLDRAAHETA